MIIARSIFIVRTQRISCDIHNLCVAEKNGSFSQLFFSNKRRKLCFVINALNTKTIILLNLAEYLTIIRRRRIEVIIGEYSPIITEPEANNCFSINTQVIISKKRKKKHFNAKSSSLTVAKRLLAATLSVEVIIG